jgi:SAM-dependent methyltransferase
VSEANQYANRRYMSLERLYAYVQQFSLLGPDTGSILEVGNGPGIFEKIAKAAGCDYLSLDYSFSTRPDLVGDVTRLPLKDKRFDFVFCCQVLEHIPFEAFTRAVEELCRLGRKRIAISVPDNRGFKRVSAHLPLIKFKKVFSVPGTGKHIDIATHGEHFWEIGGKGFKNCVSTAEVREKLGSVKAVKSIRDFRLFERPYQHFFILGLA